MVIIVYGLGQRFEDFRNILEYKYDVIGYSDRSLVDMEKFIEPSNICQYSFDYLCVTTSNYFEEIRDELNREYGIPKEKIVKVFTLLEIKDGVEDARIWVTSKLREIPRGLTLLDAGAGEMRYKKYATHLKYIAQDFGKYDPSNEPGGLKGKKIWDTSKCDILSDITEIPLEDESCDIILCSEVFEHLCNPIAAVNEFSRLLKKGGRLLLTAPFCSLTHQAPYYYYNGFSEYWYRDVLGQAGFDIVEIKKSGNLFMWFAQWLLCMDSLALQYTGRNLDNEELVTISNSIDLMRELSKYDKKSSESLCFGLMIEAKKSMEKR